MATRGGFRSLVIGLDGSAHSRHAVAFVTRIRPPARGRATLVRVVEPVRPPSLGLLPASVRAELVGQADQLEAARLRAARRDVEAAARTLRRSGWRARGEVRVGVPLAELLAAVKAARADLFVLGARGAGPVTRLLLGSVAKGATRRSPVSALIVR